MFKLVSEDRQRKSAVLQIVRKSVTRVPTPDKNLPTGPPILPNVGTDYCRH